MAVFIDPFNFSFFIVTCGGTDLDYCDIEWFALETNRDHSIVFEIASSYCILDSFVDHDGYTLDEGYLLTAAPPDLERGVDPLGPPVPAQQRLLEWQQKSPKCSTWMQSQKRQNDLC